MYKSLFDDAHAQLRIHLLFHLAGHRFYSGLEDRHLISSCNKEDGNSHESVLHDITIKLRLLLSLFWLKYHHPSCTLNWLFPGFLHSGLAYFHCLDFIYSFCLIAPHKACAVVYVLHLKYQALSSMNSLFIWGPQGHFFTAKHCDPMAAICYSVKRLCSIGSLWERSLSNHQLGHVLPLHAFADLCSHNLAVDNHPIERLPF